MEAMREVFASILLFRSNEYMHTEFWWKNLLTDFR